MPDLRSYPRQFVIEFIDLYRRNPCLWKVQSTEYNNRDRKTNAYNKLIDKLSEVENDVNRDLVIKKINNIRSPFRRELKKVQKSIKLGERVYRPTLWYFQELLFLSNDKITKEYFSNKHEEEIFNIKEEEDFDEEDAINDADQEEFPLSPHSNNLVSPASSVSSQSTLVNPKKRKRHNNAENCSDILSKVDKIFERNHQEDEFDILGKYIATKLRKLPFQASVLSQKLISDVLCYADLGEITTNTTIQLKPPG